MKDGHTQSDNPNELTIENSVLVLIDHQPWIGLLVHSIDPGLMINSVAGLAQAAKNLGVPTILTTIGAKGSILVDPLFKELTEIFPDVRDSSDGERTVRRPGAGSSTPRCSVSAIWSARASR